MRGDRFVLGWALASAVAWGCGAGQQPTPEPTAPPAQAAVEPEPEETVAPEPEPAAEPEPEPEPAAEPEPEPEAQAEPPEPPLPPLAPESADDIEQALFQAATDIVALRRLVDPQWGVGAIDPESGPLHICDVSDLAAYPQLGFVMSSGDTFQCDRRLRRCSVRADDGRGHVFHFREGDGEAIYLNAIVHYERRVPPGDDARVGSFLRGGDGVCALWRGLTGAGASPPAKLSVFVSGYTGLVPETLVEHHCADEAAAAYQQRVAPVAGSAPQRCDRNPTRCTWASGDEEITVYGEDGTPTAVAVTRPAMRRDLDRGQQRELDAFLRAVRRHSCD